MKSNNKKKQTQFAVLGLGRFGAEITKALFKTGAEVLAVDIDEERTFELSNFSTHSITADASEETCLKQMAINTFDTVIVAIGDNMQASIMCAFICKELGCKHIIAKARDSKHAKILEKIGVDEVVIPEADSAIKTATKLLNPQINDLMELADGYSIAEFVVPEPWLNRTLIELQIPNHYHVNILIILGSDTSITMPSGETLIKIGDKIIVGGFTDDIKKLGLAIDKLVD